MYLFILKPTTCNLRCVYLRHFYKLQFHQKLFFDECTKHKQIEKDEVITNSLELRNEIIFTCNQRVVCSKPIEYSS